MEIMQESTRPEPARDELVARLQLMEDMVTEGRRATARFGWVFVMWGLIYFAATGWVIFLPHPNFAWPVCVGLGVAAGFVVNVRRKQSGVPETMRSRSIGAVWKMMGAAVTLFAFSSVAAHHANSPEYVAAILFFIGLAHATSAVILRWGVQGGVAALWWICGIAVLFAPTASTVLAIFLMASFFGMIVFGLYVMTIERGNVTRLKGAHS